MQFPPERLCTHRENNGNKNNIHGENYLGLHFNYIHKYSFLFSYITFLEEFHFYGG